MNNYIYNVNSCDCNNHVKKEVIATCTYKVEGQEVATLTIYNNQAVKLVVKQGDRLLSARSRYTGTIDNIQYQFKYYIRSFLFEEKIDVKKMLRRLIILAT